MVYWLQSLYYSQVVPKVTKEKAAIKNDRKITQKVNFFKLGKFSLNYSFRIAVASISTR